MSVAFAAGVSGGIVVTVGATLVFAFRKAFSRMPTGIAKKLRTPGDVAHISYSGIGYVWNPARSLGRVRSVYGHRVVQTESGIYGPGKATYRLDDQDVVHLHFEPRTGKALDVQGPLPEELRVRPRLRHRALPVHLAHAGSVVVGFVIGFAASGGSVGDRAVFGVIAAVGAVFVLPLLLQGALVTKALRTLRQSRSDSRQPAARK